MLRHGLAAVTVLSLSSGVFVSLESVEPYEAIETIGRRDAKDHPKYLAHGCKTRGMRLKYQCDNDNATGNLTQEKRLQLLKFQVDCRGTSFQNLTVNDYDHVCARLSYRKYGNKKPARPVIEMLPWVADAALRLERDDVVDIECIPKQLSWWTNLYARNRTWYWEMTFRFVVDGDHDAKHMLSVYPVAFEMNFLPDMESCLTALAKKYQWTMVPLSRSMNYSSQLVRYSSPTLDFPPQNLFAKLGDPVYDLQVTGDIFQSDKDSLYATVLEATLDTLWTDQEPVEDWLVRLDPEFYSSVSEIPNRFALDLKLDVNTAVIPSMATGVRVKMGFKTLRKRGDFVPYEFELPVTRMQRLGDSRSVIWLMVALFLVILVAALSYAYREECSDFAAQTFHRAGRGRGAEEIEMHRS